MSDIHNQSDTAQNEPDAREAAENTAPVKKKRKWLTATFNIASGAAVAIAVKTLTVSCLATIASPVTTIVVAAAAAGIATSYLRHTLENYRAGAEGREKTGFTLKQAGFGAGFGILGAGLVSGLDYIAPDLVSNSIAGIKNFFGLSGQPCAVTPPVVDVQPVIAATPLAEPVAEAPVTGNTDIVEEIAEQDFVEENITPSTTESTAGAEIEGEAESAVDVEVEVEVEVENLAPVEKSGPEEALETTAPVEAVTVTIDPIQNFIDCLKEQFANGDGYSKRIMDAVAASESSNPKIAAQGLKDISFFLLNGLEGMPKDPCLAVDFLNKAAECGNLQACVDLAYLQYHGKPEAGIEANPVEALARMKEIGTAKAQWFVEQWTGTASTEQAVQTTVQAAAPVEVSAPSPSGPVSTLSMREITVAADGTVLGSVDVTGELNAAASQGATATGGSGMDCKPVIYANSGDIDFHCTLPDNDTHFTVGETVRVTVQRPALLHLVR